MFAVDLVTAASKKVLRSISLFKMKWASSGDKGIRRRKAILVFCPSFHAIDLLPQLWRWRYVILIWHEAINGLLYMTCRRFTSYQIQDSR